jgi:dihydrofolate synthase/folylpolyglutamate synthase
MPDSSTQPADLAGWLAYLERLHPKAIAMGLERVNQVKQRLGLNPDFPIITVGGTNGKGSTCAMLESILTQAGYSVACYSSPHLLQYNERVRVAGSDASDADLCRAFAAVEAARGDVVLTYFEFGTLAAMWYFIQCKVDVAVLEVGLGGRLDAVNAFTPSCAIITCIDIDHIEFLGNTRASIGFEKAGIYRVGVPAICGDADPPESIPHHAQEISADYRQIGVHFGFDEHRDNTDTWDFWSRNGRISDLPKPLLTGNFQLSNAACALEALCSLPLHVDQHLMRLGLLQASLQGRFQKIADLPEVIVDVAHNPHAAQSLAQNLRNNPSSGRTIAVLAMLADKDMAGVVRMMQQQVDVWYVAGIQQGRGAGHEQLAQTVRTVLPQASLFAFPTVTEAYMQACRSAAENDRIVIFGSFYTVADVLRASIN